MVIDTAIVHDISCPLCREKYGDKNGKKQEQAAAKRNIP